MDELYNLPENLMRKAFALGDSIHRLKLLNSIYSPIFEKDPMICHHLEHLQKDYETVIEAAKKYPGYEEMIEDFRNPEEE